MAKIHAGNKNSMITTNFLDELTHKIVDCAVEVHKQLGAGLLEGVYHKCFVHELYLRNLQFVSQIMTPINYKGLIVDADLRLNVLIEDFIIVELKAVEEITSAHETQLLAYLKLLYLKRCLTFLFLLNKIFTYKTSFMKKYLLKNTIFSHPG